MVKEEIVEGLKSALARGESLEKAMESFYNAGYEREEIEDAARSLQSDNEEKNQDIEDAEGPNNTPDNTDANTPVPSQKVSRYEYSEPWSTKRKIFLILVITLMIIIIGAIVGMFLFRDELMNYLNNFIK